MRATQGVEASSRADEIPPNRMNGRRRPSQPIQVRSERIPASGETIEPSTDFELPSRLISRYEVVKLLSHRDMVKLLKALKIPTVKDAPRYAIRCPLLSRLAICTCTPPRSD